MQLFLDMDGVICDWVEGVRQWFGVHDWYPTAWEIPYQDIFGLTSREFWDALNNKFFWEMLPWTRDGKRIMEIVNPLKPCILSHGRVPQASAGKIEWLYREIPSMIYEGRFLLCGMDKSIVARKGAVLIDDYESNCNNWEKAGGVSILYPRAWNSLYKYIDNPLHYLKYTLLSLHHEL